mgnify:CR=1 FL=1
MTNLEGKKIDPKKLGPRWKLREGDSAGTHQVVGSILTDRFIGAKELIEKYGVFSFGGPPLQVVLFVTIALDSKMSIQYWTVDASCGTATMVGPPVDCDTTEEDEEVVQEMIQGFLKD